MGPLEGTRIIEMAGIGPAPFCAMLLADLGADVIRVERRGGGDDTFHHSPKYDLLNRNKRHVALDLKSQDDLGALLRLVDKADVLIEGFRPGVMEKIGAGPDVCIVRNPRLVYGRMTGWGQNGPLRMAAGHDLNYIALSGALAAIGHKDGPPVVPLNLVGDFGGGSMYLAMGVLAAMAHARKSGIGQVVDCAMVDGAASLMTPFHARSQAGTWIETRGENLLDGGAPFYSVYETEDGKHVSLAALEPRFYREFLRLTGLDSETLPEQYDRAGWPLLRERFRSLFSGRTREEWCELLEGTDCCFAPVLTMSESRQHPHMRARQSYLGVDGVEAPAPAPRFSETPGTIRSLPQEIRIDIEQALSEWGLA
nr:CaiB/BaiF CoA-transferase family protein [Mesorhizobium sp.]